MLDERLKLKKGFARGRAGGAALGVTSLLVAGAQRGAAGARWDAARARRRAGGASGAGRETNSQRETKEIPPGAAPAPLTVGWGGPVGQGEDGVGGLEFSVQQKTPGKRLQDEHGRCCGWW